jgi:hypothetical protein
MCYFYLNTTDAYVLCIIPEKNMCVYVWWQESHSYLIYEWKIQNIKDFLIYYSSNH